MKVRLDRWLSILGICSRSEGKDLIRNGAVRVNGQVVKNAGATVETETDTLLIRGQATDGRTNRHAMLHKPTGLLTAARDRKQPTVMNLLPSVYGSIGCMPVGRLDKDTTGLLILTCDGEMNHRLLAPGRHVEKVYEARVTGLLSEKEIRMFADGIRLSDFIAEPAKLEILAAGKEASVGRVTVREGKFHQIKRMFAATGHEVQKLHRNRFGPIELPADLAEGGWRELTEEELRKLREAAGMEQKTD